MDPLKEICENPVIWMELFTIGVALATYVVLKIRKARKGK